MFYVLSFRLLTYVPLQNSLSQCELNTPLLHQPLSPQQPLGGPSLEEMSEPVLQPNSTANEKKGRILPQAKFRAESGPPNRREGGLIQNRSDWWAIGAGLGAVAVGIITALALSSKKNNR